MDPVPRTPATRVASPQPLPNETVTPSQESYGEPTDDPFSTGHQALPYLLGVIIALTTVVVPIFTVVWSREARIISGVAAETPRNPGPEISAPGR